MYIVLAIHHPVPERATDTLDALQSILDGMEGAPGLTAGYVGWDGPREQVFALCLWEGAEQFNDHFPWIQEAVARSGIRDWAARPPRALKFLCSEQAG